MGTSMNLVILLMIAVASLAGCAEEPQIISKRSVAGQQNLSQTADAGTSHPGYVEVSSVSGQIFAVGETAQFTASAIYAQQTKKDVTGLGSWSISDQGVADISPAGVLITKKKGKAQIRFSYQGKSTALDFSVQDVEIVSLKVDPAEATLSVGDVVHFDVVATLKHGMQKNVTSFVSFQSVHPELVNFSQDAKDASRLKALRSGTTKVRVSYGKIDKEVTVTVTELVLDRLEIEPVDRSFPVGVEVEFSAKAFSKDGSSRDITESVVWTTSDSNVAGFASEAAKAHILTTKAPGHVVAAAAYRDRSSQTFVQVGDNPVTKLAISPSSAELEIGQILQFKATAELKDKSTIDVTPQAVWSVTDETIVKIGNDASTSGSAVAQKVGATVVSASFLGIAANAVQITVADAPPGKTYLSIDTTGSGSGVVNFPANPTLNCESTCSHLFDLGAVVQLTAVPAYDSEFAGWSGECSGNASCTVTLDKAKLVTAAFEKKQITVAAHSAGDGRGDIVSNPAGLSCGATCEASFDMNSVVTLTTQPDANSEFSAWSGPCYGQGPVCSLTLDAAKNVAAHFVRKKFAVRYTKSGAGTGNVLLDGGSPCANNESQCRQFSYGTTVTLTAQPDQASYSTFSEWRGACSGSTCTITVDADKTAEAVFEKQRPPQRTLSISFIGPGSVRTPSGEILCECDEIGIVTFSCQKICDLSYPENSTATFRVHPAENFHFDNWTGCDNYSNDSDICTVNVDRNRTVIGYVKANRSRITVTKNRRGNNKVIGRISTYGWFDGNADCTHECTSRRSEPVTGSEIQFTAIADQNSFFAGWTGACSGKGATCSVTLTEDTEVGGDFVDFPSDVFATTWARSANYHRQIKLPLVPHGTYDFIVHWGDGTSSHITRWDDPATTHDLLGCWGDCYVNIQGTLIGWSFENSPHASDPATFKEIRHWGSLSFAGDASGAFAGTTNLRITATDQPNLAGVTTTKRFFAGSGLTTVPNISQWDVSSVTDMTGMFEAASNFNDDLGNWDVSNVQTMHRMFASARQFCANLNSWQVGNVRDMSYMFNDICYAPGTQTIDLSNWDVSRVTNMEAMFKRLRKPIIVENWNVANVTNMNSMFEGSIPGDIGQWKVGKVTDMHAMFKHAKFNHDISSWDVSRVTDMSEMFVGDDQLSATTHFNQNISGWNTQSVQNMRSMFATNRAFNQPIGSWNVANVRNMSAMFSHAANFNHDISAWNVANVTDMSYMFKSAAYFNQPIGSWNVSRVENMAAIFNGALRFNQDLNNWNVENVTTLAAAFEFTRNFDKPLNNWKIRNVRDLTGVFASALKFSKASYSTTLIGWSEQDVQPNVNLSATVQYSAQAAAARNKLIQEKGWTIVDWGME